MGRARSKRLSEVDASLIGTHIRATEMACINIPRSKFSCKTESHILGSQLSRFTSRRMNLCFFRLSRIFTQHHSSSISGIPEREQHTFLRIKRGCISRRNRIPRRIIFIFFTPPFIKITIIQSYLLFRCKFNLTYYLFRILTHKTILVLGNRSQTCNLCRIGIFLHFF